MVVSALLMLLLCVVQVRRRSSNMAAVSYDQLLRQVEVLKMENSNLRQELQDNSDHLNKLETEASNMKVSTTQQAQVQGFIVKTGKADFRTISDSWEVRW